MLSLLSKNKNKKKHFNTSFGDSLPKKIVFGSDVRSSSSVSSSDSASISGSSSASHSLEPAKPVNSKLSRIPEQTHVLPAANRTSSTTAPRPRLIPPSERQESGTLPAGMFVTSVDVEEGMTVSRKKKKNANQKWGKCQEGGMSLEAKEEWMDPESFYADPESAKLTVPDVEPQPNQLASIAKGIDRDRLYATTEREWSNHPKIDRREMLSIGRIVGWWVSIVHVLEKLPLFAFSHCLF